MLEAVIFDWGGTLTPWHDIDIESLWLQYTAIYDSANSVALAHELFEAENVRWAQQRESWGEAGTGSLDFVFDEVGIDTASPLHEQALAAYLQAWEPHTLTRPECAEVFTGIKARGLKIGILSNTTWPRTHHEHVFERDGVADFIDGAVYTSETVTAKPHGDVFHAAMAAIGVTVPQHVVFVGDRPWDDIHGAQQVGMKAVLIPHSNIPAHQHVEVPGEPDGVIADLRELLPLIDQWR